MAKDGVTVEQLTQFLRGAEYLQVTKSYWINAKTKVQIGQN